MKRAGKAPARQTPNTREAQAARDAREREEELKALRREICRKLHNAVEVKNDIHKRFVSGAALQHLWEKDVTFSRFYKATGWPEAQRKYVHEKLIKVLSILIYIRWDNWDAFYKGFIQHNSRATVPAGAPSSSTYRDDRMLPIDRFEDILIFLEDEFAQEFHYAQYIFCPAKITFNDWKEYKPNIRLPIIPGPMIGQGAFAKVFRDEISEGCYIDENGNPQSTKQVVARKQYTAQTRHFKVETERVKSIMDAIRTCRRVVQCIGGFIQETTAGVQYNLLYKDLADMNLEEFLKGPRHGYPSLLIDDLGKAETYAHAKPEDMLLEIANLANALDWLHKFRTQHLGSIRGAHNDLKLDNILVVFDRTGGGARLSSCGLWKISDFGLAEFRAPPEDQGRATGPLKRLLAPGARFFHTTTGKKPPGDCSAPELAHIQKHQKLYYPQLADIYSFGCILTLVLAYACGEGLCNQACGPCDDDCTADECSGCDKDRRCGPKMVREVHDELEKIGESRCFYDLETWSLKQSLYDWLRKLEQDRDLKPWLTSCVTLIIDTLHPNHSKRPSASKVEKRLDKVVQLLREDTPTSPASESLPPRSSRPPMHEPDISFSAPGSNQRNDTVNAPNPNMQPSNTSRQRSATTESNPVASSGHATPNNLPTSPKTESPSSIPRPRRAMSNAISMFSDINNMSVENGTVEKLAFLTGGEQSQSFFSPCARVVGFISPKTAQPIKLHYLERWMKSWHVGEPTKIWDHGIDIPPEEGYRWGGINLNHPYIAIRSQSRDGNMLRVDNVLKSDLGFKTMPMATDSVSPQLLDVRELRISQAADILLRKSLTTLWVAKLEKISNEAVSIKYKQKIDFAKTSNNIAGACFSINGKFLFSWNESQLEDEFVVYNVDNLSKPVSVSTYEQDQVLRGRPKRKLVPLERGFIAIYLWPSYLEYAIFSDFGSDQAHGGWKMLDGVKENTTGEFAATANVDALFFLAKSSSGKRRVMVSKIRKDETGRPYLENPVPSIELSWHDREKSSSFIVRCSFKDVYAWVSLASGVIERGKVGHYPPSQR